MLKYKLQYLIFGLFFFVNYVLGQVPRDKSVRNFSFHKNIQNFKYQDSLANPPEKAILLIGSSSFTGWYDVQDYFPEYKIINRGFGGSRLVDLIYAYHDIVPIYNPRQIIIYCGENDLSIDNELSAEEVLSRFKILYALIRIDFGNEVRISYVSMKPSPARKHLMGRFEKSNLLIKEFLNQQEEADYIDLYQHLLNKEGKPKVNLFLEDQLHNNAEGYKVWQKVIEPFLIHN